MKITEIKQSKYCNKFLTGFNKNCGDWDLKHNEYSYCDECMKINHRLKHYFKKQSFK